MIIFDRVNESTHLHSFMEGSMCYFSYPNESHDSRTIYKFSLHGELDQLDSDATLTFSLGTSAMIRQSVVANKWLIFTHVLAFSALINGFHNIILAVPIYAVILGA